jgi:hypothetical protein
MPGGKTLRAFPVTGAQRTTETYSSRAKTVYEPLSGSTTTIHRDPKPRRICQVEVDPVHVDAILR